MLEISTFFNILFASWLSIALWQQLLAMSWVFTFDSGYSLLVVFSGT